MDHSKPRNCDPIVQEQSPAIFRLPAELRLEIYTLVVGSCASIQHPYTMHGRNQIALQILLVNRQIYYEARLLPFRTNVFDFDKRSVSGTHLCRTFLQRLCNWQIRELQHITLAIMERDLTLDLCNSIWIYLCTTLGGQEHEHVGLRRLRLTINGHLARGGEDVLDHNACWVFSGLLKLKTLQSLEIVVTSHNVSLGLVDSFRESLHYALLRVSLAIRVKQTYSCVII
jgi:hypothetical protein